VLLLENQNIDFSMPSKKLENKTVFITGGLSGIGKACAIAAANEGANVAVADLKSDSVKEAMDELTKINPNAIFIECDVSNFEQVRSAVQSVLGTFSTLDVAFNNAGIGGKPDKVGDMPEEEWTKVLGINLTGVFNCMRNELPHMVRQKKGVIVNTASVMGKVGIPKSSHYVAAKHGVIGLTQTAAIEYATQGIRINAICPGFVDTPLLTKAHISQNAEAKQHIIDLHPMKRLGKAEEIAKAFIFLASEDSSFISGTGLEIDGGYLAE
jgi:NAD(P)-dependent dehydrogenase (short-subunit alcohol dehydrogenase family)